MAISQISRRNGGNRQLHSCASPICRRTMSYVAQVRRPTSSPESNRMTNQSSRMRRYLLLASRTNAQSSVSRKPAAPDNVCNTCIVAAFSWPIFYSAALPRRTAGVEVKSLTASVAFAFSSSCGWLKCGMRANHNQKFMAIINHRGGGLKINRVIEKRFSASRI